MDKSPPARGIAGSNQSEIARFRAQIEAELRTAEWAKQGLAVGTAKHRFISRRMDAIGTHQKALAALVGEEGAMEIVYEVFSREPVSEQSAPPP